MITKFPNASKWFSKIKYKKFKHPSRCCGRCKNSYCHNPGANVTGLTCRIIEEELGKIESNLPCKDKSGITLLYSAAVGREDICNRFASENP